MNPLVPTKKVCVDLLEAELLSPKKKPTVQDVYKTVLMLAQCFVATTRQVDAIDSSEEKYGRRKDDFKEPQSSFDVFKKWLADKIVPPLLVGAILSVGQVFIFVMAFMIALANGWIKL